MPLEILILEDNEERRAAMSACLADRFRHYVVKYFASAAPMIAHLERNPSGAIAISLDHDLEFSQEPETSADPGTGREVVDFLVRQPPACPVIIASTNTAAAGGMELALQEADWTTYRVTPFNDVQWISSVWIQTMRRAIVDTATEYSRTQ